MPWFGQECIHWVSHLCWNFISPLDGSQRLWTYLANTSMLSNYFQQTTHYWTHISFLLQASFLPLFLNNILLLFILCVSNPTLCSYPYNRSLILLISPPLILSLALYSLSFQNEGARNPKAWIIKRCEEKNRSLQMHLQKITLCDEERRRWGQRKRGRVAFGFSSLHKTKDLSCAYLEWFCLYKYSGLL